MNKRGDLVLHPQRPDLLAVAGPAPLLDVILHLGLDFQIAAAEQEEERLDLQFVDEALEEVGDLAALDDFHLLFQRVGAGPLALLDARSHGTHARHVEEVHLLDHFPPFFAQAVRQHGHDQFQHAGLDGLQFLVAHARVGTVFEDEVLFLGREIDVVPGHVVPDLRIGPFVDLRPLAVQQEADAGPVAEDGRVVVAQGDPLEEVGDLDEQRRQRGPVVPEQGRRHRHVAVFGERVAAQQAVDHRLGGLEAAAIDRPHVGEGVEDVHPPFAIDLLVGELARQVLEERFQLGLLPGRGGRLALGMEAAGEHPQPLGAGQGADHHGILRRDAGPDAVLGGEAGHQGRGFLRTALRVQVVVEGEVLVIGRFAQRFVAADGAIVLALRAEHLAHEKALAHLRRPVGRGGHRHLRRGVEAARQAAKLQDFELVALVDRQQFRSPSAPGCTPKANRTNRLPGSLPVPHAE